MKKLFKKLSTFQLIIISFALIILLGTVLLTLPVSSKAKCFTPFSDALFTATSATCVTGLVVHDTATYWSNFGQVVILLLIQIGGLGIFMTKKIMDDVAYDRKDDKNILTLKKKID